jgi:L-arabinokinase
MNSVYKVTKMKPIAYYITAHGYGHGTRSCDVLRALHRLAPEQPVIVTSDLPLAFLQNRLAGCRNIIFRPGAFDVGLVQKDSVRSDLFQTLEKLEDLYNREESLIVQEQNFFRSSNISLVVADIPAIPLGAAQRTNLHNVAIGNFSWDWIYETYAKTDFHWEFFVEKFRAVYEETELLLRLPFAPPMEQFPNRKDIPLLATPGANRRSDMADISYYDISPDPKKIWVLLSFTSLELSFQALEKIKTYNNYEFFCVQPLEFPGSCVHSIDRNRVSFSDIMASCDIVISKPGFGLVSECIVNGKPLIYSDRDEFAEYPILVEGIKKYLRNVHIPSADLYAGNFFQCLEKTRSAPEPAETIAAGGAEMIAKELLHYLSS